MEVELNKKPISPIIIEGFPGFGLLGTIVTEFLIDQLKAELIGTIKVDEAPAIVAVHDGKVVQPIGIFYDKKTNIMIMHVITSVHGIEWQISKSVIDLANRLKANEVLCIEGVSSPAEMGEVKKPECFYYTNDAEKESKFKKMGVGPLKEGIIIGVTGALMLDSKKLPMSCIFAEAHTSLPDSNAAAEIIKILDSYLGLKLDPAPLVEQAQKFEQKIQKILERGQRAVEQKELKEMNYVG